MIDTSKKSRFRIGAAVALFLYAAFCLLLALELGVWRDEAYTLHSTDSGWSKGWDKALHFELQAPLYFASLGAFRGASLDVVWARAYSLFWILLSVLLLGRFTRRHLPGVSPALAQVLFALHPVVLWAATEARMYAMGIFWSLAIVSTYFDAFVCAAPESQRLGKWVRQIAFVLAATVSLYTFYYLGFLLLAGGIALLARGKWRDFGRYSLAGAVVALLSHRVFFWIAGQASHPSGGDFVETLSFAQSLRDTIGRLEALVLPLQAFINQVTHGMTPRPLRWGGRVLFGLGLFYLFRTRAARRAFRKSDLAISLLAFLGTLFVVYASLGFFLDARLTLAERYFTPALVPLFLLVLGVIQIGDKKEGTLFALVFFLVPSALFVDGWIRHLQKPGDTVAVASYLNRVSDKDSVIAVFPSENALALRFHLTSPAKVVPLPDEPSLTKYDPARFAVLSDSEVTQALGKLAPKTNLYLYVEPLGGWGGVDFGFDKVKAHLDRHYQELERVQFADGVYVLHLRQEETVARPVAPGGRSGKGSWHQP